MFSLEPLELEFSEPIIDVMTYIYRSELAPIIP